MNVSDAKKKINCVDCGKEFESLVITLMNKPRILSPYCFACRDKRREEYEKQEREAIEKERMTLRDSWISTCGIPRRFANQSFETFENRGDNTIKIKMVCEEYAEQFPLARYQTYQSLGLFSKGIWGNGKSHLACSIARRVIERWVVWSPNSPVIYITEPLMFRRIRATFNRSGGTQETENGIYSELANIPLLIVDDVGKEEVADARFVQRVWFNVINERYDNMLPIVITANLSPDEIASHLGSSRNNEAAFDRLYEMVNGIFWENTGGSYRRK